MPVLSFGKKIMTIDCQCISEKNTNIPGCLTTRVVLLTTSNHVKIDVFIKKSTFLLRVPSDCQLKFHVWRYNLCWPRVKIYK